MFLLHIYIKIKEKIQYRSIYKLLNRIVYKSNIFLKKNDIPNLKFVFVYYY